MNIHILYIYIHTHANADANTKENIYSDTWMGT